VIPVSAQIITALRQRAEALDGHADALEAACEWEPRATEAEPYPLNVRTARTIAREFRALADQAEAR
jgi:hypothetical protein